MGNSRTFILILTLCLLFIQVEVARSNSSQASKEIDLILSKTQVRGNTWSILIQSQDGSRTFYSKNSTKPLKPASNIKLFTTACAYDRLGWNHSWNGKTIQEAIKPINKRSINSQADSLLRHIGSRLSNNKSMWAGAGDVMEWGRSIGIDMSGAVIKDGSGLSHSNRLSARQMVCLLRYMTTEHRSWDESLAIGAIDGTIRKRFHGTPAARRVHAKTGTLSGVICLSGIVETQDGDWILFSFLANKVQNPWATRKAIDRCVSLYAKKTLSSRKVVKSTPKPAPKWIPKKSSRPVKPQIVKGITVDNTDKGFRPGKSWSMAGGGVGDSFYKRKAEGVSDGALWSASLPSSGIYRVMARWSAGQKNATEAPYIIMAEDGEHTVCVNQRRNGGEWVSLGEFKLSKGNKPRVLLSCWTSTGSYVVADAVRFEPR